MALGRKTGGRKKGTPNKLMTPEVKAVINAGGTPLEFLLGVMRCTDLKYHERVEAAKAAAPYVHPKLANVELTGKDGGPLEVNIVRYTPPS